MKLTIAQQKARIVLIENVIEGIDIILNEHSYTKPTTRLMVFNFVKGFAVGYATANPKDSIDPIIYFTLLRGGDIREQLVEGIAAISNGIHEQQELEKEIGG